jgi:molybdopterin molybdotransferase
MDVPPHDNSAMDGYAFDGSSLSANAPLRLQVAGRALAGQAFTGQVGGGQCLQIMTGAILPPGLDTVVPQELVKLDEGRIEIAPDTLRPGDNRRLRGEDVMRGSIALANGSVLGPAALGLLASLGLPTVSVFRKLRVAYFSTGDEILSLGDKPREGAVYDSNRYTGWGLLQRMGIECIDMGVVRDDPDALKAAFLSAAQQADAIVTSGGVSVGEADHTKAMMRELAHSETPGEGGVVFWKIAMRPGKPLMHGRMGEMQILGLPGNPVSAIVCAVLFLVPLVRALSGDRTAGADPSVAGILGVDLGPNDSRQDYLRASLAPQQQGLPIVTPFGRQDSSMLRTLAASQALLIRAPHAPAARAGDPCRMVLL